MYLFFDTETTGLPNDWNAPASDTRNWPRMVQIAFQLYEQNGTLVEKQEYIIKPEGFIIPSDASRIHGVTTDRALKEGKSLSLVLNNFQAMLTKASALVAHNMAFDEKIIGCEFYRNVGKDPLPTFTKFCTMKDPSVINYCAIPPIRYGSYKWPKLSEMHYKLFGIDFDEAHNASADIQATARCFFELRERNII